MVEPELAKSNHGSPFHWPEYLMEAAGVVSVSYLRFRGFVSVAHLADPTSLR